MSHDRAIKPDQCVQANLHLHLRCPSTSLIHNATSPHQGAARAVPYLGLIKQFVEHVLVPLGQSLNVAVEQLLLLLLVQLLRQVPAVVLAQLLAGLAPPQLCGAHLLGQTEGEFVPDTVLSPPPRCCFQAGSCVRHFSVSSDCSLPLPWSLVPIRTSRLLSPVSLESGPYQNLCRQLPMK